MILSKKSWYMRLYYVCAWLQARATFKKRGAPLEDPKDLCPMIRMYVFWAPLSLAALALYAAFAAIFVFAVGMLLYNAVYGVVDWNGPAGKALREVLLGFVKFATGIAALAAFLWVGGYVVYLICWVLVGIVWVFRKAYGLVARSPLGVWTASRFPKAEAKLEAEEEDVPEILPQKLPKKPRGPTFIDVFLAWLDGKLHGFCSQITVTS